MRLNASMASGVIMRRLSRLIGVRLVAGQTFSLRREAAPAPSPPSAIAL